MKNFDELRERTLAKPGAQEIYEDRFRRFLVASSLSEIRRARELTQVQLAESMEATQPAVSRIEHQADLYVHTLRSYIEAMGGELEIVAVFPNSRVVIDAFKTLGDELNVDSGTPHSPDRPELQDA